MLQSFLDFFFPRQSLTGEVGEWVTTEELRSLGGKPFRIEIDDLQKLGLTSLDTVAAAAAFDSPLLRRAIHSFKYRRIPGLGEALGSLLVSASLLLDQVPQSPISNLQSPFLCPVPLHWSRRYWRGFNQAQLLAQSVADARGWEMRSLLKRTRATGSQAKRDRQGRLQALDGAFVAVGAIPEHVILIDDVMTTGTTLNQCAAALKHAGVARVDSLVLARG